MNLVRVSVRILIRRNATIVAHSLLNILDTVIKEMGMNECLEKGHRVIHPINSHDYLSIINCAIIKRGNPGSLKLQVQVLSKSTHETNLLLVTRRVNNSFGLRPPIHPPLTHTGVTHTRVCGKLNLKID